MLNLKAQMIDTAKKHAEATIALHKTNIDIYMNQSIGIGEHSDIMETIQLELDKMDENLKANQKNRVGSAKSGRKMQEDMKFL